MAFAALRLQPPAITENNPCGLQRLTLSRADGCDFLQRMGQQINFGTYRHGKYLATANTFIKNMFHIHITNEIWAHVHVFARMANPEGVHPCDSRGLEAMLGGR